MRILLVDDQADMRLLMRSWLGEPGWEVAEAVSGEEALERRDEPFDVFVVDHLMDPGMNGLDLARALREVGDERPIVICSAFVSPDLQAAARDARVEVAVKQDFPTLVERVQALGA